MCPLKMPQHATSVCPMLPRTLGKVIVKTFLDQTGNLSDVKTLPVAP